MMQGSPSASAPPLPPEEFQPVACVLAFLIPGAGHAYLGMYRRAALIFVGVLGLFFGGMLIGGINTVDRRENFVWFLGQSFVGPIAFGVDYLHDTAFKVYDQHAPFGRRAAYPFEIRDPRSGNPVVVRDPVTLAPREFVDPATGQRRTTADTDRPPYIKSLGRINEIGTLYATIAGMMNLICIIDAVYHRSRRAGAGGGF
ncbi:MAG: hypothetical protein KF745_09160 [Phycisphaeraceae bacterium]|nr:hypothetical protein [Phycisphaeraceae bacterium]